MTIENSERSIFSHGSSLAKRLLVTRSAIHDFPAKLWIYISSMYFVYKTSTKQCFIAADNHHLWQHLLQSREQKLNQSPPAFLQLIATLPRKKSILFMNRLERRTAISMTAQKVFIVYTTLFYVAYKQHTWCHHKFTTYGLDGESL